MEKNANNAHLIAQLYKGLPSILINLTLMPLVMGWVMWGSVNHQLLIGWIIAAAIVLVIRYSLAHQYTKKRPDPDQATRWARYFTWTSLLSGLTWGFAGWAFFVPGAAGLQVFLYVCIVGLAAGSIIVTSYWLPAYHAYAIPSVGISAARLMAEGGAEYFGLALLIVMYLAIVTRVARIQHQSALEVSELRFSNLNLIEQLQAEKHAVEAINTALDLRVRERTAELEAEVAIRRDAERQLEHQAHHDALTGLPNRTRFSIDLEASIRAAQQSGQQFVLLFLDLDRFKEVNDTLGHALGDDLLIAVAGRLLAQLKPGENLARLGGDEFVMILHSDASPEEIRRKAGQLIAMLTQPFSIFGHELYLSASIGVCVYPADGDDVDTLVRNADTAMYRAKANGRGRFHFYSPEMTSQTKEWVQLDALLRRAIDARELSVHYQMKVDQRGHPVGAEALLRWNSAELGTVNPAKFIPIAEETGYIVPLGNWVIRQVCQQMASWLKTGLKIPRVAVNLSVKQVEHGQIESLVTSTLREFNLPVSALELEITESVIMNMRNDLGVFSDLAASGIWLAIDDFGTGYSSLSYLKTLPVNTLKIDKSFVMGIGHDAGDEAIIIAIIALAKSFKLHTVAEGVETREQLDFLCQHGVQDIQGHIYSVAASAEQFSAQWRTRLTLVDEQTHQPPH